MEDYNSPEAVAKRANQEDPIIMYLIVRESLGMSIGKTAAQCAHASQMLQMKFINYVNEIAKLELSIEPNWEIQYPRFFTFQKWLDTSFRKVVLKADEKEFNKVLNSDLEKVVVIDAGLTELESGTTTVLGLWPMKKSKVPKIIKKLQTLK